MLTRRDAQVFWGITDAELEEVIARGLLRANEFGHIIWGGQKHVQWRAHLKLKGKRICDLERAHHRRGLRQIKVVNRWAVYMYKESFIRDGMGDSNVYVYAPTGYLERVFNTLEEAIAWCVMWKAVTSVSQTTAQRKLDFWSKQKSHGRQIEMVMRDSFTEKVVGQKGEEELLEAIPDRLGTGGQMKMYVEEVQDVLNVLAPHFEELGEHGVHLARKMVNFLSSRGMGFEFIDKFYKIITPEARPEGKKRKRHEGLLTDTTLVGMGNDYVVYTAVNAKGKNKAPGRTSRKRLVAKEGVRGADDVGVVPEEGVDTHLGDLPIGEQQAE